MDDDIVCVFFLLILHFSSFDVHNEFITSDNARLSRLLADFQRVFFEIHFVNIRLKLKTAITY